MKKAIIFLITIVVIIAGVIFAKKVLNKKYDYKIEEISEFKYYIYKDSNKYGVIDETGKIIIEANYEKIIIPNPSKAIFICYNENKTEVFNQNKEKLFSKYESVEPIKLKNVAGTLNYEKSVLKYKQDGKYGLFLPKGTYTVKVKGPRQSIQVFENIILLENLYKHMII